MATEEALSIAAVAVALVDAAQSRAPLGVVTGKRTPKRPSPRG